MAKLHVQYRPDFPNLLTAIGSLICAAMVGGCETAKQIDTTLANAIKPSSSSTANTEAKPSADYHGPRARLTVLRFTDATNGKWRYTNSIGEGMTRKLVSSLVETQRFRVLDRRKVQDSVAEVSFGASGLVDKKTAAKLGQMVGAQLTVTAVVTDFDEKIGKSSSSQKGISIPGVGKVTANTNSAYMAVNIEVIDVETSEIVTSRQVEGKVTDVNMTGIFDSGNTGLGDVRTWDQYPRGKALQQVINGASGFLAREIPARYFTEPARENKPIASQEITGKAQRILKDLGYYNGKMDGRTGPQFSEAVKKFQDDYGLSVTGEIDPPTREKLLSLAE